MKIRPGVVPLSSSIIIVNPIGHSKKTFADLDLFPILEIEKNAD